MGPGSARTAAFKAVKTAANSTGIAWGFASIKARIASKPTNAAATPAAAEDEDGGRVEYCGGGGSGGGSGSWMLDGGDDGVV